MATKYIENHQNSWDSDRRARRSMGENAETDDIRTTENGGEVFGFTMRVATGYENVENTPLVSRGGRGDRFRRYQEFRNAFKTEVVIVEMSHFYGDPDEDAVEQLASEVLGALGELVVPYYPLEEENFWTRPLEESVKKNQRVLIAFENFNAYNTTEKHSPFLWPWVLENGYADTDDVAKMKEYNYDVVRTFNNQTEKDELRLTKLSWILTAKAKTVENSIWPLIKNHHPKTIVDLTLKYADRFVFEEFVDLVSKDLNCRFPQVFSLDAWFADSSFRSRSSSKSNNSKSNNGRTNRDDDEVGEKEGENRKGVLWKLAKEVSARQNSPAFAKEKCKANAFADDGKRLYSQQYYYS